MVSILIINYKTYELTKNTINSIVKHTSDVYYEIILLDNASNDGSVEKLEEFFNDIINSKLLKVIRNPLNGGFSYGNNIGINHAMGDIIILVNSDIEINSNIIREIDLYLNDKNHNEIVGPKIILPNGKFEHGCKRGFPTPKNSLLYLLKLDRKIKLKSNRTYKMNELGEDEIGDVDAISGAFFAMPKKIINEIGYLDESFFMYGEDLDWCYRTKAAGFNVVYNPKLGTVTHFHGQSGKKLKWKVLWEFYRAMLVFHKKHYKKKYNIIINTIVYAGIYSIFLAKAAKNLLVRS